MFEDFGKAGTEKSGRSVFELPENLEYGINLFQETWNGNLITWEQYLPKNMKCFFESVDLWDFETSELWNIETKEPRNQQTNKPRNQETKKRFYSFKGLPITPQFTDAHNAPAPLLGDTRNLGDTRELRDLGFENKILEK